MAAAKGRTRKISGIEFNRANLVLSHRAMPASTPDPSTHAPSTSAGWIAGRYEVLEEIARGGMGVVYRVVDHSVGAELALKRVLVAEPARWQLLVSAFEREYRVLASLDHPRIIKVFDYGVDADGPYYTMELLSGRDLRSQAPAPWRSVCQQLRDIATALSLLHARRLIHRDLNPGNVKLAADGHCTLLDFGALSDFGKSDLIIGIPPMMPPEVLEGAALDQRTDLYALGALAYWLLTGEHAFRARSLHELEEAWERWPRAPSSLIAEIPKTLDALVLSLLRKDPLARPSSAAEVIARLNAIGQLAPEHASDRHRLAASFLTVPPFVGRDGQLGVLQRHVEQTVLGQGAAVRIVASAGAGCSRLLEELSLRAQIAGAAVLRADASMHPGHLGTVRALATRLLDLLPEIALEQARSPHLAAAFAALGPEFEARVAVSMPRLLAAPTVARGTLGLDSWMIQTSRQKPLVIQIDNLDYCDDASLGVLVALSQRPAEAALLLVLAERVTSGRPCPKGLAILREHCEALPLSRLTPSETLALARSLFGDAPNVERFAEWLHGRTEGSPLHAVEISRQLVAQNVIRHEAGFWVLPASRPKVELHDALEDVLRARLRSLGAAALALAQTLSLQRTEPTFALCSLLVRVNDAQLSGHADAVALDLLEELARGDVILCDQGRYRFSSTALREAVVSDMSPHVLESRHSELGRVLEALATKADLALRIEAGWHFMHGGEELRGADMVAAVMCNGWALRKLGTNNYPIGPASDAALKIYNRHRRSGYERLPLLAAVSQAGYFEELRWSDEYSDEALDVMEDISGMRLANRLRRFLWGWLALSIALVSAALRFFSAPRRERGYSFVELLHLTFGAVTGLVAAATISLDSDRADRIARVIAPFESMPQRDPGRGIYTFCRWLSEIGREHPVQAFSWFEVLCRRFEEKGWYRQLPEDGRALYVTGSHYARGAFAAFRAHGQAALESADVLEASSMKIYVMIASQIRFMYYANRGELALAKPHRDLVEVHAAHVGSAWQAELWEDAGLLPLYISSGDVVAITRVIRRFDELAQIAPALKFYRRLAELALMLVSEDSSESAMDLALRELDRRPARSFIGWSTMIAILAGARNAAGRHAEARALCDRALSFMTDEDREYVTLFIHVDIQTAFADAGLGDVDSALARIDSLLVRFSPSGHPLALGLLHECRALIAHAAGRTDVYKQSLAQCERWFRGTGTPALVAKSERLLALSYEPDTDRPPRLAHTQVRAKDDDSLKRASEMNTLATEIISPRDG